MQSYQRIQHTGHSDFNTSGTNGPRLLSQAKVGTHSAFRERSHTAAYTPKQGRLRRGRYHYPRRIPHVHEHPRAGCQNGVLCRFWVLAGGALPKNAESLRSSDALMRVAVPRRRSPAGLRDLFRFCRNCGLYTLGSPRKIAHKGLHGETRGVLDGGAITTLGAFRTFRKPCVAGA